MNNYKYIMAVALILLVLIFSTYRKEDNLRVGFLDVGQGDAIIVRTPRGQNILIDGGPDNRLLSQLADFLPWWERKIDYLVISHYHADHLVGLIELLNKYKVEHILVTAHGPSPDFLYQTWQRALAEHKLTPSIVRAGQKFIISDDLYWQILSADSDHKDYNENSLVIRLTYGQVDFLLMGDLPAAGELKLLEQGWPLESEVLKVGHHGSKYSSSADFLQRVKPELCLIESGLDNKFGHPHRETMDRLAKVACQIFNTQNGTIKVRSDGQNLVVDKY